MNTVNLAVPIAFYILGDAAYIVPVLLRQQEIMVPVSLAVLDHATRTPGRSIWTPLPGPSSIP